MKGSVYERNKVFTFFNPLEAIFCFNIKEGYKCSEVFDFVEIRFLFVVEFKNERKQHWKAPG